MCSSRSLLSGLLLIATILILSESRNRLQGCAPAPHPGERVEIRDESALIIWDSTTKTEHFIRRASFETSADDFGFLVPSPTKPELGEADDRVFQSLDGLTAARHVFRDKIETVWGFGPLLPGAVPGMKSDAAPNSVVEVLDRKQVAGFDATVLRADDVTALAEWLNKHGYEARPTLIEWLKWYVDQRWIITAFKLVKGTRSSFETKSVRMSFQTEQPFYPYREPEDMRSLTQQGSRALRVFLLADQRYEGRLGEIGTWPATTVWASDIGSMSWIRSYLKLEETEFAKSMEGMNYLTEFEDRSFPRPGTDEIYFRPSADQSSVARPPIKHTNVVIRYWPGPWGALSLAVAVPLFLAIAIVWMVRRRRVAISFSPTDKDAG
jgi:hypothetical protein